MRRRDAAYACGPCGTYNEYAAFEDEVTPVSMNVSCVLQNVQL